MTDLRQLGAFIRECRTCDDLALSLSTVAHEAGISRSTLYRIESGHSAVVPRPASVSCVLHVLGVLPAEVSSIVGGEWGRKVLADLSDLYATKGPPCLPDQPRTCEIRRTLNGHKLGVRRADLERDDVRRFVRERPLRERPEDHEVDHADEATPAAPPDALPWLLAVEAAAHLGVEVGTLQRLKRAGLPYHKMYTNSGGCLFLACEIDQWLATHRGMPRTPPARRPRRPRYMPHQSEV